MEQDMELLKELLAEQTGTPAPQGMDLPPGPDDETPDYSGMQDFSPQIPGQSFGLDPNKEKDRLARAMEIANTLMPQKTQKVDPYLSLGLALLQSNNPSFLGSLGQAGASVVGGMAERKKLDTKQEDLRAQLASKLYGSELTTEQQMRMMQARMGIADQRFQAQQRAILVRKRAELLAQGDTLGAREIDKTLAQMGGGAPAGNIKMGTGEFSGTMTDTSNENVYSTADNKLIASDPNNPKSFVNTGQDQPGAPAPNKAFTLGAGSLKRINQMLDDYGVSKDADRSPIIAEVERKISENPDQDLFQVVKAAAENPEYKKYSPNDQKIVNALNAIDRSKDSIFQLKKLAQDNPSFVGGSLGAFSDLIPSAFRGLNATSDLFSTPYHDAEKLLAAKKLEIMNGLNALEGAGIGKDTNMKELGLLEATYPYDDTWFGNNVSNTNDLLKWADTSNQTLEENRKVLLNNLSSSGKKLYGTGAIKTVNEERRAKAAEKLGKIPLPLKKE